ncbi:ABC transporter ATP-binding protein [Luteitalea sp. TBR-22]|uniref:ABC transporter ATP-binding protein n=1 Tax=Luteitalea sp. TBR-22 TaxID=2802971 RepID=UPI001AF3DCFD|nr:ABC transporter ATP-binding protein [Luteitalea sp. TBR-22]
MPLLSVRHLSTGFPHGDRWLPAVQDVSFEIAAGETLALVGESGSGKSLTAFSLLRLVPPPGRIIAGEIRLDGQDLMALPEAEMEKVRGARISLIFQEPMSALNPVLTIGSQLVEAMTVHGRGGTDPKTAALDLLATVRMDDPARRFGEYPHQLSGGLRQRALIALALCCRPALLVADEPTTALDVTIQAEILNLLRQLKHEFGLSLLLITHDLGVVAHTADRVAVMYAGRIVEVGPVRALFKNPAHPYTQALLRAMPGSTHSARRLEPIEGQVPALDRQPPGCAFAPRCAWRHDACDAAPPDMYPVDETHASRCVLVREAAELARE